MKAKEIIDKFKLLDSISIQLGSLTEEMFEILNTEFLDMNCTEFVKLQLWVDESLADNAGDQKIIDRITDIADEVNDIMDIMPTIDLDEDCEDDDDA